MKQNILSMLLFAAVFVGCRNEEIEKEFPSGKTAVTIEVEGAQPGDARSVSFTGGTAYGEGLYDGVARPTVGADASDGYEIDYFYGGPSSEPRKYDYTSGGSSTSFNVYLNGMNHSFKCSFKEKKRTLTLSANPSSGGTVSGSGTFKVKKTTPISASPASGYTFSGWTVSSGDATIANASSASTTATLQSSNSTLTANFTKKEVTYTVTVKQRTSTTGVGESYTTYCIIDGVSVTASDGSNASASYTIYGTERQWYENNGNIMGESESSVSLSDGMIVEEWCEGYDGVFSHSQIYWKYYKVTVNSYTVQSTNTSSGTYKVDGAVITVNIRNN